MKRLFCFSLLTILFVGNLFAQKYHDAAAVGLKGHVKEVVINSGGPDPYGYYGKCTFDGNGALTYYGVVDFSNMINVSRSNNGYLKSFSEIENDLFFGQSESLTSFSYDSNNRVSRIVKDLRIDDFYYNSQGYLYKSKDIRDVICYYEIKEVDNHGNYTSVDMFRDDEGKRVYLRTIKRTITYYSNNSKSAASEASSELPLVLNINGRTVRTIEDGAMYIQAGQTSNLGISGCMGDAVVVRTKTGKMIDETGFKDYTVETDADWLDCNHYKTKEAFIPLAKVNNTGQSRTAFVSVIAGGKRTTFLVTQRAY